MGEIINLRGVRKAKAKAAAKDQAAANRERFGRTAEQRQQQERTTQAASRKLDSVKLEP